MPQLESRFSAVDLLRVSVVARQCGILDHVHRRYRPTQPNPLSAHTERFARNSCSCNWCIAGHTCGASLLSAKRSFPKNVRVCLTSSGGSKRSRKLSNEMARWRASPCGKSNRRRSSLRDYPRGVHGCDERLSSLQSHKVTEHAHHPKGELALFLLWNARSKGCSG